MARKERSDSIHALTLEANTIDISTLPSPKVDGDEILDATGKQFFADVWRSDPARFTVGDLGMLVEASYVFQQMRINRMVCAMTPLLFELRNGVLTRHPVHVAQAEYSRQLQTLMRDLGVRSKDGFKPAAKASVAPAAKPAASGNVMSFKDFLNGTD